MKDDIISRPFNGLTSSSIIVGLRGGKKGKIRWVWISRGSITSRNHNEALESLVQVAFISAAWFTPRAHHRGSTRPAVSRGKLTPKSDLHICPLACSTLYSYVFFILFYLFGGIIAPTLWTMSQSDKCGDLTVTFTLTSNFESPKCTSLCRAGTGRLQTLFRKSPS